MKIGFMRNLNFLRYLFVVEVVLLIVLFISGMVINLFENVPFQVNFAAFGYTVEGAGYGVHHYITLFVIFFGVLALLLSVWMKNSLLSKLSIVGLVSLIISMLGGTALVYFEVNEIYSLVMSAAFISALIVYVAAVFLVKKTNAEKTSP